MTRYWHDLPVGERFVTTELTLEQDSIEAFARQFDPQPYHLDTAAAEASIFGGLCASGWQVAALMMRMLTDSLQQQHIQTLGMSAVPAMRWRRPVFAGDRLHATFTIVDRAETSRQPGCGSVDIDVTVNNQDKQPVINLTARLLVPLGESTLAN